MENLSNTSQSFRTQWYYHALTRLFLCLCMILLLFADVAIQAEENGDTKTLVWGMSRSDIIELLGPPELEALIYKTTFFDKPVMLECLLEDHRLVSQTMTPLKKQDKQKNRAEYDELNKTFLERLGKPNIQEDHIVVWTVEDTRYMLIFNGQNWIVKLEEIPADERGE